MDELALLKEFRLDDASPNGGRERARAALRAAVAHRRRARRRAVVALALGGAAILAGAAFAVVHELGVGDAAPEEVREQPARFGHNGELIPLPHPDDPRLEEARVAAVLDSSAGTVYLFRSPSADGVCASTWIAGDRGYQGRLNISSSCGPTDHTFYAFGEEGPPARPLRLFSGRAGDGVRRIALRFGERTVDVPLTGGWFLAEFASWPDEFLAYDASGRVVERHSFLRRVTTPAAPEPPHATAPLREVARIGARDGAEQVTLLVAPASDGGFCQVVRSERTPQNSGCSVPRPGPRDLGVEPMSFGGTPGGILLLVGPVGSDVAALDVRYEDGRVVRAPLDEGWALYEVDPVDYAAGRRPEALVGRDASGRVVASVRLPWAGSARRG